MGYNYNMEKQKLRTWVEISRSAILHNFKEFERFLPNIHIMPVVKSNAYGHGIVEVAKTLEPHAQYFGVVFIEEALQLRKAGITKPVLVFSTTTSNQEQVMQAIQNNISFTIYNQESYQIIDRVAEKLQKQAIVHINVDTGMTRLGFKEQEHKKYINTICHSGNIKIQGIYSHLSSADNEFRYTNTQYQRFKELVNATKEAYQALTYEHILNTPGAMLGTQVGNLARIGRGIYGLIPSELSIEQAKNIQKNFNLQPALEWKTHIIQIREVGEQTSVGYGRSFITAQDTKLAILPVGYADGYSRGSSNCGEVLIRGIRCAVRGKICMNNIIVDVSNIPDIKNNEQVVLIGTSQSETILPRDIGTITHTIGSEVITAIDSSIPRIYID